MQQDKLHDISNITSGLKAKFASLARIPDELLPTGSEDLYYLLAKRNSVQTLSVYLLTENISKVLACLGQTVPSVMQEFLDNTQAFILDIDSITDQGPWRFYLRIGEYNEEWVANKFPQTELVADTNNKILEGLGFYFDPQSNQVTQYKYYWFDLETRLETRQRFTPEGQFLNSQSVVFSGLSSNIENSQFGINDIDTSECMLKYSYAREMDQQYIAFTKDARNPHTKYIVQSSYGGGSVEPATINDL
jgi:hypothetical protein